jgi:hypothetical protein
MAETRALAARLAKCEADLKTASQLIIADDGALVQMTPAGEARSLGRVRGADGVSVAGTEVKDGQLLVTLSDGQVVRAGQVRGEAGFSLEDFDVNLKADGRTVELSFSRGDLSFTRELALPTMIYRGAYVEGKEYERGDTVTWAGSLWHCNGGDKAGEWAGTTKDKPGEGSKAWTLAAKRGRDGKDFAGPQAKAPEKVRI